MSAYLIFVDGWREDTSALVEELGLAEIQRGESHLTWARVAEPGPGGQPGMLGYWFDSICAGIERYRPDAQRWSAAPGKKFWVGINRDRPLMPEDIRRRQPPHCTTSTVELEDGNTWQVPIARSLPHLWGQGDDGQFERRPKEPFVAFCHEAERIFQLFAIKDDPTRLAIELGEDFHSKHWTYVCQALGLLYKLAPPVISTLGLFSDVSAARALTRTLELEAIGQVESQKKTSESATIPATSAT